MGPISHVDMVLEQLRVAPIMVLEIRIGGGNSAFMPAIC